MSESVPQSKPGAGDEVLPPPGDRSEGWSTGPARPAAPVPLADRLAPLARLPVSPWQAVVGAIAIGVIIAASFWLFRTPPPPVEQHLPRVDRSGDLSAPGAGEEAGAAPPAANAPAAGLVVHAAGAVGRPGVYRLRSDARVDDLIAAAGGLGSAADGNRLNLAAPLADGQRVYVPRVGELTVPEPVGPAGAAAVSGGSDATKFGAGGPAGASTGPVNINTATAEQLDTLPGVGPATAGAILDYRRQHGRFRSVDELLEVRGIGEAKLAELREKVGI